MKKKNVFLLTTILFISSFAIFLPIKSCRAEPYETTLMLYPTDDTFINHGDCSENYGSSTKLFLRNGSGYAGSLGWGWDALIKFDISSIFIGTQILTVKLKMYNYEQGHYNGSNLSIDLYRITSDWDEDTVTWDNQPNYASQNTSNSIIPLTIGSWMEWDVTDDVLAFADGSLTNYGWKITDENIWEHFDIPEFVFQSKESNNSDYWPYLDIELINERPVADFNYNVSVFDKKVDFIDNSTDPNGSIISWFWNFGDGYATIYQNASHTYQNYGIYPVSLTVTDNVGAVNKTNKNISIPIEPIIKSKIEKQFNISLTEDFYIYNNSEFIDPNDILYVIRTIYFNDNLVFLLSVNNSFENLFIWNASEDNISILQYDYGNIIGFSNDSENNVYTVNISVNSSNWTYVEVKDYYVNISNLIIRREDGSTVSNHYYWRENNTLFFLDNQDNMYQLIYNNESNDTNSPLEASNENNGAIWNLVITILIFIFCFLILYELRHKRRQTLSFYIKQGNDKINDIDQFINHIKK